MKSEIRPISARALKSVIDTLRPHIPGSNALDLFAGHGRFGIECLHEGASRATFVDKGRESHKILANLRKNPKALVIAEDVFTFLERTREKFDLIFADPPFALWSTLSHKEFFKQLLQASSSDARIILKHPARETLPLPETFQLDLMLHKISRFGESQIYYFTRHDT